MILAILLALFASSASAETVSFKGGGFVQGTIVKSEADSIEIAINRGFLDPNEFSVPGDTSTSTHPGIVVLKDGSYLHCRVLDADADTITVQIMRRQIWKISGGEAAPPPVASSEPIYRRYSPGAAERDLPWSKEDRLNELRVQVGEFDLLSKLTLQGQDSLAGPGYSFGAQYFRQLGPNLASGLEIERLTGAQHESQSLINNLSTYSQFDSLTVMALLRISRNEGRMRPYLIGGFGLHSTNIQLSAQPQAGYVWDDTQTSESRNLVDSTRTAAAVTLQTGVNFVVNESLSFGIGASYYYLGSATYPASSAGQALGLSSISGSFAGIGFTGNVGLHF